MYQRILALLVSGALLIIAFGAIQPQPTVKQVPVVRFTIADLEAAPKVSQAELECLKRNIFFEARNQPEKGMEAVALVTVNRTRTKVYPQTICGVVHQAVVRRSGRRICQFSWMCDGKPDEPNLRHPGDAEAWEAADTIARNVIEGKVENFLGDATHYHATYVHPGWANAKRFKRLQRIGSHVFYRDVKLTLRSA